MFIFWMMNAGFSFSFLSVCVEQIWTVSPNLFGLISPGGCDWKLLGLRAAPQSTALRPINKGDAENKGGITGITRASSVQICLQMQMLSFRKRLEFSAYSISATTISQVKLWRFTLTKKVRSNRKRFFTILSFSSRFKVRNKGIWKQLNLRTGCTHGLQNCRQS